HPAGLERHHRGLGVVSVRPGCGRPFLRVGEGGLRLRYLLLSRRERAPGLLPRPPRLFFLVSGGGGLSPPPLPPPLRTGLPN
ncbi:hypothetical protein, partial [Nocardia gipuzkoensis]|uniref:hypothetical protein n=1 Tax=Nocardia gipuzkoensis TaxID=2749991 RepID=UPI002453FC0B